LYGCLPTYTVPLRSFNEPIVNFELYRKPSVDGIFTFTSHRNLQPVETCPEGYKCDNGRKDLCVNPGQYCPRGTGLDDLCPGGNYCENATVIIPCPDRKYCPKGSSKPLECAIGFIATDDRSACKACPADQTTFIIGDDRCQFCPPGEFLVSILCESCPKGYFCNDGVKYACPEGSYCPYEGLASPKPCEIGLVSSENSLQCSPSKKVQVLPIVASVAGGSALGVAAFCFILLKRKLQRRQTMHDI